MVGAKKGGSTRGRSRGDRGIRLLQGDCLEAMARLDAASVDAVITDPPYGIDFNHEPWDGRAIGEAVAASGHERLSPNEAFELWARGWAEQCLRVMKPGAHLVAFGSPRTFHRLICGLEDGGLEIRDALMWLYGTGMPKSRRYPGGRSTALKPAYEPIVLVRAPLEAAPSRRSRATAPARSTSMHAGPTTATPPP